MAVCSQRMVPSLASRCFAGAVVLLALVAAPSAKSEVLGGNGRQTTILDYPAIDMSVGVPAASFDQKQELARLEAVQRARPANSPEVIRRWSGEAVTLPWTRLMLEMFVKHKISPTRAARGAALLHVAMHDALVLARGQAKVRGIQSPSLQESQAAATGVEPERYGIPSMHAAVASAAAGVLGYLFPSEQSNFDRIAEQVGQSRLWAGADFPLGVEFGLALGKQVGERVVGYAERDGAERGWLGLRLQWYGEGRWYGPGAWEPTPPYFYYPPTEPFAPGWKPWVLASPSQFRPTPPAFGSPKFIRDLREVVEIQRNLTPAQERIAKFWVDGSGSVTPPGHWNQIAIDLVVREKLDAAATAQVFAALNIALADTFIAAWDAKYYYWTIRPVTAARHVFGMDIKPAILTPPFPSYVSGHAANSGAAAQVLSAFFPKDAQRLQAMAEEAAMSRLYGGIHYRYDNEDGLALGRKVGDSVVARLAVK
jgi:membrane-associated phospholipid phosphatase